MGQFKRRTFSWTQRLLKRGHTKQAVVEDNPESLQESQVIESVSLDQHPRTSKSLGRSNLCEFCQALDFNDLFYSDSRSPSVDGDYLRHINTLENVAKQNDCPLCRLLLRVVSASSFTVRDPKGSYYEPGGVYMEPQRIDFALLGVDFEVWETKQRVASCLHIQSGQSGLDMFDHKIILLADPNEENRRPLFSFVEPLGDRVDFSVINDWIEGCSTKHGGSCNSLPAEVQDEDFNARVRVINVQSRKIERARLVQIKYAALTYVWGDSGSWLANTDMRSLPSNLPSNLPATFEDTLTVCAELNIPFLWIDMFCIDQTDEMDKRVQVPHMDAIYEGAFLTIAAVIGPDPTAGLPRVSTVVKSAGSTSSYYSERINDFELGIALGFVPPNTVWNTRAWTLQETLMSKRLLVFNKHYVSLYCRTTAYREDVSHATNHQSDEISSWHGIPGSPFSNEYYKSEFSMKGYTELVYFYASRALSDPLDSLAAVSGILNIWSRSSNLQFVAGIPTINATNALIWFGSNHSSRGHPTLPTWSWASWKGNVSYPAVFQSSRDNTPRLRKEAAEILDGLEISSKLRVGAISWHQPGSINFGTHIEEEALVSFSNRTLTPQLAIQSYVATFCRPTTTLDTYKDSHRNLESYNELIFDENGKPLNTIALIECTCPPHLSIHSSSKGYEVMHLDLPSSMSKKDEERIRNEGCDFVLLKRLHGLYPQRPDGGEGTSFRVWCLLIMRDTEAGTARRLGCIAIHADVWELGNPKWEVVVLV